MKKQFILKNGFRPSRLMVPPDFFDRLKIECINPLYDLRLLDMDIEMSDKLEVRASKIKGLIL